VLFLNVTKIFKMTSAGSPSEKNSKVSVPSSHGWILTTSLSEGGGLMEADDG
jgi:hypothetical protein